MFVPIYNWKATSMIYIPQSHTHEHNYWTWTERELCDSTVCNVIWYTFFWLLWVWGLFLFIAAFICLLKH